MAVVYRSGRLHVGGGELAYRLLPKAVEQAMPPVVMVGGWGSTMNDWFSLSDELARRLGAPVLLFDHRGIGESCDHPGTITMDELAGDTLALAEALLPGNRFVVVGHSAGAFLAQHLAIRAPERVAAIVCLSGQGPRSSAVSGSGKFFKLARSTLHNSEDVEARMELLSYHLFPFERDALGRGLHGMSARSLRDRRPKATIEAQLRMLSKADLGPELGSIRCPVLIVHGRADAVVPPENAERLFHAVSGSAFRRVAMLERRHMPFAPGLEAAREVAGEVAAFLAECRRPTSKL
mmetsp:Transcript_96122/g.277595  ORF Transcript_96122/g.277595 Transcript_96122/m.277595 type:complete len:293 (+) Transcript_96122:23-901(+)